MNKDGCLQTLLPLGPGWELAGVRRGRGSHGRGAGTRRTEGLAGCAWFPHGALREPEEWLREVKRLLRRRWKGRSYFRPVPLFSAPPPAPPASAPSQESFQTRPLNRAQMRWLLGLALESAQGPGAPPGGHLR